MDWVSAKYNLFCSFEMNSMGFFLRLKTRQSFCKRMSLSGSSESVFLSGYSFYPDLLLYCLGLKALSGGGCSRLSACMVFLMSFLCSSSLFFVKVGNRSMSILFCGISSILGLYWRSSLT